MITTTPCDREKTLPKVLFLLYIMTMLHPVVSNRPIMDNIGKRMWQREIMWRKRPIEIGIVPGHYD